ncbi:hypothetical protein C8J57DRAFT_1247703 [Mycena rebaudengoi]|nr:hypothetical protein C8J57DRAFT_1247703 [Mycena rebaudengoi]
MAYPLLVMVAIPIGCGMQWLCFWATLWGPIYILAFLPQMGYSPLTGISLLEMDQIAALLGVVLIAGDRVFRHISEAAAESSTLPLYNPTISTTRYTGEGTPAETWH